MNTPENRTADFDAIARLAQVLIFVCGRDHPVTLAMQKAAGSRDLRDIEKARALFVGLKPGLRRAAQTMIGG